jgi:hypothetical protein
MANVRRLRCLPDNDSPLTVQKMASTVKARTIGNRIYSQLLRGYPGAYFLDFVEIDLGIKRAIGKKKKMVVDDI